MVVGVLTIDFHFPYTRSIKDKRRILHGFKDRVRERFNVALAEVDHQDKWQRSRLAVAAVNSQAFIVEETLRKVLEEAGNLAGAEVVWQEMRFV
jgi:hypothetical protein